MSDINIISCSDDCSDIRLLSTNKRDNTKENLLEVVGRDDLLRVVTGVPSTKKTKIEVLPDKNKLDITDFNDFKDENDNELLNLANRIGETESEIETKADKTRVEEVREELNEKITDDRSSLEDIRNTKLDKSVYQTFKESVRTKQNSQDDKINDLETTKATKIELEKREKVLESANNLLAIDRQEEKTILSVNSDNSKLSVERFDSFIDSVLYRFKFSADYQDVGKGNYINAVKENWEQLPIGQSIVECNVGTRGTAIVYKYPGEHSTGYGYAIIFGYDGRSPKLYTFKNSVWDLSWDSTSSKYYKKSFTANTLYDFSALSLQDGINHIELYFEVDNLYKNYDFYIISRNSNYVIDEEKYKIEFNGTTNTIQVDEKNSSITNLNIIGNRIDIK